MSPHHRTCAGQANCELAGHGGFSAAAPGLATPPGRLLGAEGGSPALDPPGAGACPGSCWRPDEASGGPHPAAARRAALLLRRGAAHVLTYSTQHQLHACAGAVWSHYSTSCSAAWSCRDGTARPHTSRPMHMRQRSEPRMMSVASGCSHTQHRARPSPRTRAAMRAAMRCISFS